MKEGQAPAKDLNEISRQIVDGAIQVQKGWDLVCSRAFIANASSMSCASADLRSKWKFMCPSSTTA
jgi:hypothetical protein